MVGHNRGVCLEICYDEGEQDVLVEHLSRSMGEEVIQENKEGEHGIKQYCCTYVQEAFEMTELAAMICRNILAGGYVTDYQKFWMSEDGTRTPISLRQEPMEYKGRSRHPFRWRRTALKMIIAI